MYHLHEEIIFKETIQFVSNSFTPHQFGFLPGRSTLQQLLLFINELLDAKENNKMSDVIYLRFQKMPSTLCLTVSYFSN